VNPCIILPTYNEAEQLPTLVRIINLLDQEFAIVVIDDNSPDGTGEVAEELASDLGNMIVIHREKKAGLGSAIKEGFKIALKEGYDPIITMDADLSHSPFYLNKLLKFARDYDLLIASRYIRGVRVEGWRFRKLLLSKLANMYVAYIMVKPIWDFTSGFRVYSASFLRRIDLDSLPAGGYLFQIHMIYLAYALRLRVKEVSFVFKDTEYSVSKLSGSDRWGTALKVWRYHAPFLEILRHITFLRKDYTRFVEEYEELLTPVKFRKLTHPLTPGFFRISVGVMAYNEEDNIANCLEALENQRLSSGVIEEIIVVSSGSTDRTDQIVREFEQRNPKIHLIVEEQRRGKASAINIFLKHAVGDIVVLESADTIPEPQTIEELVKPFGTPGVGVVGAHPIPVNSTETFIGYCVHKLWELHHHLSLETPKCGEMIAFLNVIQKIPSYTAVDEAAIEATFNEKGYLIRYAPEAIVRNKGPETVKDYIKQRKRIALGHKHLLATKDYRVSTYQSRRILKYLWRAIDWHPRHLLYVTGMILIEAFCRIEATINFHLRDHNPYIWHISGTTKNLYRDAKNSVPVEKEVRG